jgi:transcriptional regulator with XRE-family HTH domain
VTRAEPWWRSRTPGRYLDPEIAGALRRGRWSRGWSLRTAGEVLGLSIGYLSELENGKRVPSCSVADNLVTGYQLPWDVAIKLRDVAKPWVGRDSPFKTGYYPREGERGLPWP